MKAKDALDILQVTRTVLSSYVQNGHIKATVSETGRYDYDEDSVYIKAGLIDEPRKIVLYTKSQSDDVMKSLLSSVDYGDLFRVQKIVDSDSREFVKLIKNVCEYKVKKIITDNTYFLYNAKDKTLLELYKMIFNMFRCELIVIDCDDSDYDDTIMNEMINDIGIVKDAVKRKDNIDLLDIIDKIIKISK